MRAGRGAGSAEGERAGRGDHEAAGVDGGVQGDDVLGVDQPGGAGAGDQLAGVAGFLHRAGEDGEQATGPQYPLAGRVQQPRIRLCRWFVLAAGGLAAGG